MIHPAGPNVATSAALTLHGVVISPAHAALDDDRITERLAGPWSRAARTGHSADWDTATLLAQEGA
ncbi:hypothetical protein [Streptomyces sp. BK340]|uniref:hypothetical protein n=1 Tax=Streptomyces sp. BK340 TaxID=2572903 RepID=UPI0011AAFF16|nr:hypothetical protein [Streptomyces sp. BK340]